MQHLFTPEGNAALSAIMARRPLLAFDFDGTLAPIVTRPDAARIPLAVARRLNLLACSLPLAIVSGRSVADVRRRLSFEPHFIVGNHGAEDPSVPGLRDPAQVLHEVRRRLGERAAELQAAGVAIEDKRHSIALHYRLARDRERAYRLIVDVFAGLGPDVGVFGGKMVVNVVASDAPDKGDAVAGLVERCDAQAALFVGDDANDEPVFVRAQPSWLTVKVGRDDSDSRAMFFLDHVGEVAELLDRMLVLLDRPPQ